MAVVELVVSDSPGIVLKQVHRLVHGVSLPWLKRIDFGNVIAQRIPLNQVAVVEQHAVLDFLPGGDDQGRGLRQAKFVRRHVLVVVVVDDVRVDVSRFQESQLQRRPLGLCAHQPRQDEGAEEQRHGQKTAGNPLFVQDESSLYDQMIVSQFDISICDSSRVMNFRKAFIEWGGFDGKSMDFSLQPGY